MTDTLTTDEAFERYEQIRQFLPLWPEERTGLPIQEATDLGEISDHFDIFVFDAFGVLNVGTTPIEGARARIDALREAGKKLFVLTNAASFAFWQTREKFQKLGFDFRDEELISSRDICERFLPTYADISSWGIVGPEDFTPEQLSVPSQLLGMNEEDYHKAEAFLFLSSANWSDSQQTMLMDALKERPRPVVVANPDLVAPRETGLSKEPGFFAQALQEALPDLEIDYHGKPFPSVYDAVEAKLSEDQGKSRIAMMGDTLHTDVLGAIARGWSTILVSDHGLFRGKDVKDYIQTSGIQPDWIIPSI